LNRALAEKLMDELQRVVDCLNALSELTMEIPDENVRRSIREVLGRSMVELDAKVIRPIVTEHPDLDIGDP
jgi:hypothetical protein